MMRLRRASMIATLSLLAWAATASAECAFVLWETLTVIGGAAVWSQRPWEVFKRPKNVKKLQKIISCQWRSPRHSHFAHRESRTRLEGEDDKRV